MAANVISFDYRPPGPTLAAFRASDAFARCLVGPIHAGRRTACVHDIVLRSATHPRQHIWRWAVVRATLDELETYTLAAYRRWIPPGNGVWDDPRAPIPRHVLPFGVRDREIGRLEVLFLAMDQARHRARLGNLELTAAWLDGARDLPQAVFEDAVGAVGQYPSQLEGGVEWSGVALSTRPPPADHWIPEIFERERRAGYKIFRQPSGLSPEAENIAHLPQGFYRRAAAGKSKAWIDVQLEGKYAPGAAALDDTAKFRPYLADPVGFVEKALGEPLWSKQREILLSVRDHRRTAVQSCHDVGKSFIAARASAWFLSRYDVGEAFVVTSAPTFPQVRAILWREIARAHRKGRLPGHLNQTEWMMGGELVAFGRKPADEDMTSFQGIHARAVLVVLDEACGIPKTLCNAAEGLITNDESRLLMIGNPDDPATEFAQCCKPGSGFNVIRIDAFQSPNFTDEPVPESLRPLLVGRTWVEERRKSWGEQSPLWTAKVRGEFPEQSTDGLVPLSALRQAQTREVPAGEPVELGVDVARFGDDHTVIYLRRGGLARRHKKVQNRDTMTVAGLVVLAIEETGATKVKIDDIGVGGGVVDRLKELKALGKIKAEIVGVNVSANIWLGQQTWDAGERFANPRAALNWRLRGWFIDGTIALEPGDTSDAVEDLVSQAAQIKYKLTSSGEILIEPKADMKKRLGGRSPDDWDALVLCFAEIVAQPPAFGTPIVINRPRAFP
jgi:hypothetical protein